MGADMAQITRNFRRSEFDRHAELAEGSELWDAMVEHLGHVQRIRDEVGAPVNITPHGGYHGPTFDLRWRRRSPGSRHRQAIATDLRASGMAPSELHLLIVRLIREGEIAQGGVGLYAGAGGYVHYDSRGTLARWRGTP